MSTWGWKQHAMFMVGVLCATGALVAAGLADAAATPPPAAISAR